MSDSSERTVGVIGGSGLYAMEGLEDVTEIPVDTAFGAPSDAVISGRMGATRYLFLPRHGRGHRIPPHRINYRANMLALKMLGAEQVISVSAVGSLKEGIHPGDMVLVDQFIDRTRARANTFFEDDGVVAHVGFSHPVDEALSSALYRACVDVGARAHRGGAYVCIEGPQFSTVAESNMFRSWNASVVGMTNLPEARLAREAELPYATLALATDYDCWHPDHDSVSVEAVVAVIQKNVATAQAVLKSVGRELPDPTLSPASSALAHAIMTSPDAISADAKRRLEPLIGRYFT
ncbi:MAG: S-methyl-5'-thioadenosine phosphorylase [Myxococcales bacterium]|nr:S-methyl-5'-thioadenosine phosphorylase [Myxococcales bacterium]